MNKTNVDIVCASVCNAFDDMGIPTAMGIDILKISLDSDAELPDGPNVDRMRQDFTKMANGMREMFLDGSDGITNEEIDAGFSVLINDAETYLKDGPNAEQQAAIDRLKATSGGSDDKSNSTLH